MIKYFKLINQYVLRKKTLLILFLTAVIPSLLAGLFMTPFHEVSVFLNPDAFLNMSFLGIYWKMSGYGHGWFLPLVALVVFALMVTVLVATVDRHMRLGDLRFRNPLRRLNENIWVVLPVFIAFLLIKEVFDIVLSLVIYLCLPMDRAVFVPVLCVVYLLFYFGFSVIIAFFVNWVPHSFDTGLSAPKSLASSVRLTSGHLMSLTLTIFMGVAPMALVSAFGLFVGEITRILLSSAIYLVLSIFFVVMMYVVYYDTTGIEREDINVVDIWDKKRKI